MLTRDVYHSFFGVVYRTIVIYFINTTSAVQAISHVIFSFKNHMCERFQSRYVLITWIIYHISIFLSLNISKNLDLLWNTQWKINYVRLNFPEESFNLTQKINASLYIDLLLSLSLIIFHKKFLPMLLLPTQRMTLSRKFYCIDKKHFEQQQSIYHPNNPHVRFSL